MKSLNDVIEMVRTRVRSSHYCYSTEQTYCHWTARYYSRRWLSRYNRAFAKRTTLLVWASEE